jgi:peptidoglycan/LPS O-acetylase OafA/YrhL
MGMSFTRRQASTLRELFSKSYFVGRFERIVYPVLLLILLEVVYGAIFFAVRGSNPLVISPQILLGWLPITGPGNYFVSIAIEFIFVFPFMYYGYRRAPRLTLITCFIVNVAFVLASLYVSLATGIDEISFFWYRANILHVIALIALGLWMADGITDETRSFSKRDRLILVGGGIGLFWVLVDSVRLLLGTITWRGFNIFSTPLFWLLLFLSLQFYVSLLVLLGIKYLPRTETNPLVRAVARIGGLSYHIFLIQIVYFTLLAPTVLMTIHHHVQDDATVVIELIVNIAICTVLGIGFALFEAYSKRALRLAKRTFVLPRGV